MVIHPLPLSFLSPFLFPLSFPLPSFLLYPLSSPPLRSRSLKSSYGGLALCWPSAQVQETITILLVTLSNIHRFKTKFTYRLSNKPFLIWLLTTPPHLKYVATLPCNLLLLAFFADINVSQGKVPTYARCGGTFNIHLTANLQRNLTVYFVNRLKKFGPLCGSPRRRAQCVTVQISLSLRAIC